MICRLARSAGKAYGVEISGLVDPGQFSSLLGELDALILKFGRINLLVQVRDLGGMSVKEFHHIMRTCLKRWDDIAKLALVGEAAVWDPARVGPILAKHDERRFGPRELEKAWAWIER